MMKLRKFLKILISLLLLIPILLILTSSIWVKPLASYLLYKNFGDSIKVEDVSYIFPNKITLSKFELGDAVSLSNVSVAVASPLKLSPITLEVVKPQIVIIHDEKGGWTFPPIPGINDTSGISQPSSGVNIEVKAKIVDGIVIIRDLKLKKEIRIPKVDGNVSWKDQKITYTASTVIDSSQTIKSYGFYDFSKVAADLSFEFKNASANTWAPLFLPDLFNIEKGVFTGLINVKGEEDVWKVKGNIEANEVFGEITNVPEKFEKISTKVKIDGDDIEVLEGKGMWNGASLKLSGKVSPKPSFEVSFDGLNAEALVKELIGEDVQVKGTAKGNLKIGNSWEKPSIIGSASLSNGSIYGVDFSTIELTSNSKLPLIDVNFSGSLKIGNIQGKVNFDIDKNLGEVSAAGESSDIKEIGKLLGLPDIEGKTSIELSGKKEKDKGWKIYVKGTIENGKLGEYSAEKITFSLENEEGTLNFDFSQNKGFFF